MTHKNSLAATEAAGSAMEMFGFLRRRRERGVWSRQSERWKHGSDGGGALVAGRSDSLEITDGEAADGCRPRLQLLNTLQTNDIC